MAQQFRCLNINARSLVNKAVDLESVVMAHKPHVLIITETWLHTDINDYEITPPGYRIYHNDRDSRGGGVAILFQDSLSVMRLPDVKGIESVIVRAFLDELNIVHWGFLSSTQLL